MQRIFKTLFPFNMFSNGIPFNLFVSFLFSCIFYKYITTIRGDMGVLSFIGVHLLLSVFYENLSENEFMFYEIINLCICMCAYEIWFSLFQFGIKIKELMFKQKLIQSADIKWLNIEIKHGGNQNIPEFLDGKTIKFKMSETKTIKDLKNEIELKVKYAPTENQILRSCIFGDILDNFIKLGNIPLNFSDSCSTMKLFIVIKNY